MNLIRVFLVMAIGGGVTAQAAFLEVCSRTVPVKVFLEQTLKKSCDAITAVDLLEVKRIAVGNRHITEFKADDFSGLANLEILNIRSNPYTALPEGLFKDLGRLKTIVIISTSLRSYPDDFLQFNPEIENLHIFRSQVKSISESVFQRLAQLKNLQVIDFDGTLLPAEKERLTKLFPPTGKVQLSLID